MSDYFTSMCLTSSFFQVDSFFKSLSTMAQTQESDHTFSAVSIMSMMVYAGHSANELISAARDTDVEDVGAL